MDPPAPDIIDSFISIPMADGRRLSGRLWRPRTDDRNPVILDVSPYRAFDIFRPLEEQLLPYWAQHGYAVLALDDAGSGGSQGLLPDEYGEVELNDAAATVDWCAAQPWCDGAVGMSGLSWAAFVALRVAARRPKALKALVLGGVSEDGWATDIHNLGGATYAGRVDWAGVMLMFNALPPDPLQMGDGWRVEWRKRLEANRPWIIPWLSHPARDGYWRAKAADISGPDGPKTPLLLYGGLADKYATSVLRIAAQWRGPVRTIIGPWEHTVPSIATREPRIGFLQEALRWWDKWLKGIETQALSAPPLRLWIGAPDRDGMLASGAWRGLDWPLAGHGTLELYAGDDTLLPAGAANGRDFSDILLTPQARSPEVLTEDLYEDVPAPFDLAQTPGTARFGSGRSEGDTTIIAAPVLRCAVTPDRAGGQLVARLLDVAPDGRAVRMTTAALNLAFHDGSRLPSPPEPGTEIEVVLPFQAIAWLLKAGHGLALLLSAEGWPTLWPDRTLATLRLRGVRLSLPIASAPSDPPPVFEPPVALGPSPFGRPKWIDPAKEGLLPTGLAGGVGRDSPVRAYHSDGTGTDYLVASRFELTLEAGGQAAAAKVNRAAFERPGWSIRTDTRLVVRSTRDSFEVEWTVRAIEDGRTAFDRTDRASVLRSVG